MTAKRKRHAPEFKAQVALEAYKLSMWIPEGFAHGFLVMSKTAEVIYKCTDYYSPADEHSLRWDDPAIAIDWPQGIVPLLSDKDAHAPVLENARLYE